MNNLKTQKLKGLIAGVLFSVAYVNLAIGSVISLGILAMEPKKNIFKNKYYATKIVSFILLLHVMLISLLYKTGDSLHIVLPTLFMIVTLSISSVLAVRERFVKGLSVSIGMLTAIDFAANFYYLLVGSDIFGRIVDIRADDLVRLGGIFGHSFMSVSVSAIGVVAAIVLESKIVALISIFNLIVNETLRSHIMLILIAAWFLLSKMPRRVLFYYLFGLGFSVCIIYFTLISESPSNMLRVSAWVNALIEINTNLLIGKHDFTILDKDMGVSEEILSLAGVAENQYLGLGLHFGVLAPILFFIYLVCILNNSISINDSYGRTPIGLAREAIAFLVLIDSFYGSFISTALVSLFASCLFSTSKKQPSSKKLYY